MRIEEIKYSMVKIPLTTPLKHARKEFSATESIIVKIVLDGYEGIGEGCPRKYVTGMSLEEASNQIEIVRRKLLNSNFNSWEEALEYIGNLKIDNSVKAAFDIAFTDAYCKLNEIYLYEYLGGRKRDYIIYDAGVPLTSIEKTLSYIDKFYRNGIRRFKLKADRDITTLIQKLKVIRENYYDVWIKIDANSSWSIDDLKKCSKELERYEVQLIEDPVDRKYQFALREAKKEISIPLMVDESLISLNDAKRLIEENIYEWFNLKISKNGGIHELMKLLQLAKNNGIKVQLGSHYGECGILESARRQVGCSNLYISSFEGANRILLSNDITKEMLKLRNDLAADLSFISEYGLGVHLREGLEWK